MTAPTSTRRGATRRLAVALGLLVAPARVDRVATVGLRLDQGDLATLEAAIEWLNNLLANAIKSGRGGPIALELEVGRELPVRGPGGDDPPEAAAQALDRTRGGQGPEELHRLEGDDDLDREHAGDCAAVVDDMLGRIEASEGIERREGTEAPSTARCTNGSGPERSSGLGVIRRSPVLLHGLRIPSRARACRTGRTA